LESFKAIESHETADDIQWLSYWVCYSILSMLETILWPVLVWIPLYSITRLLLITWLTFPQFKGATFIYSFIVRPLLFTAIDVGRTIPSLEPYLRSFGSSGDKGRRSGGAGGKQQAATDVSSAAREESDELLKQHAQ
jgi:hypothetical protein